MITTRKLVLLATALCLTGAPAFAQSSTTQTNQSKDGWVSTLTTGVKYTSWERTKGDAAGLHQKGSQKTAPISLKSENNTFDKWFVSFSGLTALYDSDRSFLGGTLKGDDAGITDTIVSGRAAYKGFGVVVPFYELSLNLPTGDSTLMGNARFARMDPDLVDLPSYGEGFNVGQTIGLGAPLSHAWSGNVGLSHTWRGEHEKERFNGINIDDVDLGDVYRAFIGFNYAQGPLSGGVNASYAIQTETEVNKVEVFEAGNTVGLGANLGYQWRPQSKTMLDVGFSRTTTDKVLIGGALITEVANTNSPSVSVGLAHSEKINEVWSVTGRANYMRRSENSWNSMVADFVPQRDKVSVGLDLTYQATDTVALTLSPQIFRLEDKAQPFFPNPERVYEGYSVAGGVKVKF